jgi:hypothetical protein
VSAPLAPPPPSPVGKAVPPPPPPPPPPKAQAASAVAVTLPEVADFFTPATGQEEGHYVNVAGPPKYGKSTFAAGAPRPVFVLTDLGGMKSLPRSIPRRTPTSWPEVILALEVLRDKPHTFETVVLDTVYKVEALAIKWLCAREGKGALKLLGGGYGAGYDMLCSEINRVVDIFFTLNARGIHTIAIHQTEDKTVKAADLDDYERTALALQKKTALIWTASADVNMFVQPEIKERDRIDVGKDKEDRVKVDFTGRAICHVRSAPGIEAGNRLFLDSPMPYSWAALDIGAGEGAILREELFAHLATLSGPARAWADVELNNAGWSKEVARRVMAAK